VILNRFDNGGSDNLYACTNNRCVWSECLDEYHKYKLKQEAIIERLRINLVQIEY
jgi:hypothetical protein